ncbi:MAG TPA: 50S ribosomal protein L4 [Patescibacteria group bacterium]|nr:50S ribosomal protein L4 [Patescibacteria group bacterium]
MALQVAIYNMEGKKVDDLTLSERVFGVAHNAALLHQAYNAYAANRRTGSAHTKMRGERSGSGKKPWRQKGTGNARTGSVRNPIWRKGGIVFGPRSEKNFTKDLPQKMKQKALRVALSDKARGKNLIVIDQITLKESKTKEFAKAFKNFKLKGQILVGFSPEEAQHYRAVRNIANASGVPIAQLTAYELLNHRHLILSMASVKKLEEKYHAAA